VFICASASCPAYPAASNDHASPVDDYLAVHSPIMIETAMPSAIMIMPTTDNYGSTFAVRSPKAAVMVAVSEPDVNILRERGHCNAQSQNGRNNKQTASHCTTPLHLRADNSLPNSAASRKFRMAPG
jgi:hypothetical protein